MMLLNEVSRYHVAAAAIRAGGKVNPKVAMEISKVMEFLHKAEKAKQYALEHGQGTSD
jgi:xylulose-5-phosphate/fructose-6-phosphate phosphoketolase